MESALEQRLRILAETTATLDADPRESIRPGEFRTLDETIDRASSERDMLTREAEARDILARESVDAAARTDRWITPPESLQLGDPLGEGGMGVVSLGFQRSVSRKVAIKSVKPELRSARTVEKLLNEARVTGYLEHPNIVPVHDISSDLDGSPLVVLKRIEGQQWTELIRDPVALRHRFSAEDALTWHLDIFQQVCNAIAFAHSRGVLHRDLKPDNVMIGEFGEVYIVDWGLAVRLPNASDSLSAELPFVEEAREMAGTPHYMAPEMMGSDPPQLSERTDVYLLGAILYEVLTGKPPHAGETILKVLMNVASGPRFEFDSSVPLELANLVKRAMARDPGERFESVRQLRDALTDYRQHRGSLTITETTREKLADLRTRLAQTEDSAPLDSAELHARFAECRFGFRLAMEGWSSNPQAAELLDETTTLMIEHALRCDEPRAAARHLAELRAPPPELRARVEAALARAHRVQTDLERLRASLDPSLGRPWRVAATMAIGVWWTLGPVVSNQLNTGYGETLGSLVTPPVVLAGALLVVGLMLRKTALRSILNRQIWGAGVLTALMEIVVHLGGAWGGLSPPRTHAIALLVFGAASGALTLVIAAPMVIAVFGYLLAFVVALHDPELRFAAQSMANLVWMLTLLWAWYRGRHPLQLAS